MNEKIPTNLIVRGYFSELIQSSLFFVIYLALPKRWCKNLIALLFLILYAGNIEHIRVNKGNMLYTFSGFLMSKEFLTGSVFSLKTLSTFTLVALVFCSLFFIERAWRVHSRSGATWKLPVILGLAPLPFLFFVTTSPVYSGWLQQSLLEDNFRVAIRSFIPKKSTIKGREEISYLGIKAKNRQYKKVSTLEIQNGKSLLYTERRPEKNVLLILVEGLSKHHQNNNTLSELREISESNFSLTTFVTSQRQTNRGLYAVLCGRYPNLVSKFAKADIIGSFGSEFDCLPDILKESGFETFFLQSAPLGFMRKDLFAREVGFAHIKGDPPFDGKHLRSNWGVDDATLYKVTLDKIMKLREKPERWFMTLLTVSTHHPFTIPGKSGKATHNEALRFADKSLSEFLSELKRAGVMENTLVVVTTDEANGTGYIGEWSKTSSITNFLADSLGPLVVIGRRVKKATENSEIFSQIDIPASILDYLELDTGSIHTGRSFFRKYESIRPVYFANVFRGIFGRFKGATELSVCDTLFTRCGIYTVNMNSLYGDSFTFLKEDEMDEDDRRSLLEIININDFSNEDLKGRAIFQEKERIYREMDRYIILRNFKIQGKLGDELRFSMSIDNSIAQKTGSLQIVFFIKEVESRNEFQKNITVSPGELREIEESFKLKPEQLHLWLSILVIPENSAPWKLNSAEIQLL